MCLNDVEEDVLELMVCSVDLSEIIPVSLRSLANVDVPLIELPLITELSISSVQPV